MSEVNVNSRYIMQFEQDNCFMKFPTVKVACAISDMRVLRQRLCHNCVSLRDKPLPWFNVWLLSLVKAGLLIAQRGITKAEWECTEIKLEMII